MNETPTYRCTHYAPDHGPRCTADATHRLLDEDGWRVPGGIYCQEHAREIVDEYREKLDLRWTIELLSPQAVPWESGLSYDDEEATSD